MGLATRRARRDNPSMDPATMAVVGMALAKSTEGFAGEAGKGLWTALGRVVNAVRSRMRGEPALTIWEQRPDDLEARSALARAVRERLNGDPEFRHELTTVLGELEQHQEFAVQVQGNAAVGKIVNVGTVQGDLNF